MADYDIQHSDDDGWLPGGYQEAPDYDFDDWDWNAPAPNGDHSTVYSGSSFEGSRDSTPGSGVDSGSDSGSEVESIMQFSPAPLSPVDSDLDVDVDDFGDMSDVSDLDFGAPEAAADIDHEGEQGEEEELFVPHNQADRHELHDFFGFDQDELEDAMGNMPPPYLEGDMLIPPGDRLAALAEVIGRREAEADRQQLRQFEIELNLEAAEREAERARENRRNERPQRQLEQDRLEARRARERSAQLPENARARRNMMLAQARDYNRGHVDRLVAMRVQRPNAARPANPAPAREVIDLTLDDDDDVHVVAVPRSAAQEQSHNLRRRHSQQQNAPRLNRSDANYVGEAHEVIEISSSDDEAPQPVARPVNRGNHNHPGARSRTLEHNRHHHHHHHHHHHQNDPGHGARNARVGHLHREHGRPQHLNGGMLAAVRDMLGPIFGAGAGGGEVDDGDDLVFRGARDPVAPRLLNYAHSPFAHLGLGHPHGIPVPIVHREGPGAGPNKPPHAPPPAARDGFTRDTGEEVVAICPSCNQELAYDPDEQENPSAPSKKRSGKAATREHHFWAVKACGHVYCSRCFDNRAKKTPTKHNHVPLGFRLDSSLPKKVFCAVDDCKADVSNKSAWVGLFL